MQSAARTAESAPAEAAQPVSDEREQSQARLQPARKKHSISSLLETSERGPAAIQEKEQDASRDARGGKEITLDAVKAILKEVAEDYRQKKNLYSALSSARVDMSEEDGRHFVRFYVLNEAQKMWMQSKLQKVLEDRLRSGFGTRSVTLLIEEIPETEKKEQHLYMPSEKAKYMMEKSEEVRNLCDDLGLDLK